VSASSFGLLAAIERLGNLAASRIARILDRPQPELGVRLTRRLDGTRARRSRHERARAIATRWRSPPESWGRFVRSRNQVGTAQRTPDAP
jgi:hypothetical protein